METRSHRILSMAIKSIKEKDRTLLENLNIPYYESTKGTDVCERTIAIQEYLLFSCKPAALEKTLEPQFRGNEHNINAFHIQSVAEVNSSACFNADLKSQSPLITSADQNVIDSVGSIEEPYLDSGSEYIPSVTSSTSDEEVLSNSNNVGHNFYVAGKIKKQPHIVENIQKETNKTNHTLSSDKLMLENEECNREETFLNVNIKAAQTHDGQRIRDKGHSCCFCQKIIINNVARHFEVKHKNESEVAKILAKPKSSKERRYAFLSLIRCGDFYHNCETLALKKGELILTRRPTQTEMKSSSYTDYGPCPECLGFMLKRHIWHHLKYSCKSKTDLSTENTMQTQKMPIAESSALLNGILGKSLTAEYITNIINKFKDDLITLSCKEDETILKFGAFLYEKYNTTQSELIRQSMRQLGRLTIELRKLDKNIKVLKDCLVPEKFDMVVKATKELCISTKEPTKKPEFKIPSLALKLGYALRKCISIERGQALKTGNLKSNKTFLSFLALLDLEWSVRISSNALSTLYTRKKTATDLLPITSDLVKLSNYVDSEMNKIKSNISNITSTKWTKLASLTLTRIILFNKRRSGEAAKMTMSDYASRPAWDSMGTQELKNSLTSFENKLASKLTIVKITGKRGRIVPVIVTKEMKESIDVLILNRVKCGIPNDNPYIFAITNTSISHMRGHDCLKKWCSEAELQSPDLITSTKLRKYVATVCQIFNLNENEYDWLARHLGHDVRVHREFYRLQENAVELTKVSRLLLAVDQGEAHKYSGKELKDIKIDDLPDIDEDDEDIMMEEPDPTADNIEEPNSVKDFEQPSHIDQQFEGEIQSCENVQGKKNRQNKNTNGKRNYSARKPWSSQEKELIFKEFKLLIKTNTLPGKQRCCELKTKYPIFSERKWSDIKFYVKNYLTKLNKRTTKLE